MKSKIKLFLLVFTALGFLFTACNESEDLVTSDVQTGGLVVPTANVPYKLGATPTVDINLTIPVGPGIASVEVYNIYTDTSGVSTNEFLMKTIDIGSGNTAADMTKPYSITYADLINGLQLNGAPLPSDETLLPIGAYWELSYISVMADGARKVVNNATTTIAVANIYAGWYLCTGTFHHPTAGDRPINEEKFLVPETAYSCRIPAGDLGGSGYFVTITVDPATNDVSFSAGEPTDFFPQDGKRSFYNPLNGTFELWYYYVGANGNRVIDEVYTPL